MCQSRFHISCGYRRLVERKEQLQPPVCSSNLNDSDNEHETPDSPIRHTIEKSPVPDSHGIHEPLTTIKAPDSELKARPSMTALDLDVISSPSTHTVVLLLTLSLLSLLLRQRISLSSGTRIAAGGRLVLICILSDNADTTTRPSPFHLHCNIVVIASRLLLSLSHRSHHSRTLDHEAPKP